MPKKATCTSTTQFTRTPDGPLGGNRGGATLPDEGHYDRIALLHLADVEREVNRRRRSPTHRCSDATAGQTSRTARMRRWAVAVAVGKARPPPLPGQLITAGCCSSGPEFHQLSWPTSRTSRARVPVLEQHPGPHRRHSDVESTFGPNTSLPPNSGGQLRSATKDWPEYA